MNTSLQMVETLALVLLASMTRKVFHIFIMLDNRANRIYKTKRHCSL